MLTAATCAEGRKRLPTARNVSACPSYRQPFIVHGPCTRRRRATFALYNAESNPCPFERTGQPTPPIAQAVDVRHVEAEAYKTHMIVQTSYEDMSMTTRQTLSWRCAYCRLQKCAVCRLRAMEEHKSTSAMKHEYKASCAGAQNIFVRSCVAARQWVAQIHHRVRRGSPTVARSTRPVKCRAQMSCLSCCVHPWKQKSLTSTTRTMDLW